MYEKHIKALKKENITKQEVEDIIFAVFYKKGFNIQNKDCQKVIAGLKKHSDKVAEVFNCKEEDIYFGDIHNKYPYYQVVFGNVEFEGIEDEKFTDGCLIGTLIGDLNVRNSRLDNLGFVKTVINNVNVINSNLQDTGALNCILGNFNISGSRVGYFDSIKRFEPGLILYQNEDEEMLCSLGLNKTPNLFVGYDLNVTNSKIGSFFGMDKVGGDAVIMDSEVEDMYFLTANETTYVKNCNIYNFSIGLGKCLYVGDTKIQEYNPYFIAFKPQIIWESNNIDMEDVKKNFISTVEKNILTEDFEK